MDTKNCILYARQSTNEKKQRNSLSVQLETMRHFCSSNDFTIVDEYTEIMSGTITDRPVLNEVVKRAIKEDLFIVILRVDRLSRDLKIYPLVEDVMDKIRFVQFGDTKIDLLVFSVLLAVSQNESKMISIRTKMAMQNLKSKGRQFGSPDLATQREKSKKVRKANAVAYAKKADKLINEFISLGYTTNKSLTLKLNAVGFKTRNGKSFSEANLYRLRSFIRRNLKCQA